MFITIEGGEGAGKSTLLEKLKSELSSRGYGLIVTRAPGGTPLGQHLRQIILNPVKGENIGMRAELMLYLADRAQHIEEVIAPALKDGDVVLCDRFNDSTIAYQGGARGLGMRDVSELCQIACQGLNPDITFFLDIDPKIGFARIKGSLDRMELEKIEFHQQVREAFHLLAHEEPDRLHIIDASKSPEEVFASVMNLLTPRLK